MTKAGKCIFFLGRKVLGITEFPNIMAGTNSVIKIKSKHMNMSKNLPVEKVIRNHN